MSGATITDQRTGKSDSVDFNNEEIIERISALVVSGVSQAQIGKAFGVSQERISQLLAMPTFMAIVEKRRADLGLKYEETNDLIDAVEQLAWKKIHKHMEWNADADFALRAAMIANKSVRRGQGINGANIPLDASAVGDGGRAIINLHQTFVTKLVQITTNNNNDAAAAAGVSTTTLNMKTVNVANPAVVERILDVDKDNEDMFKLKEVPHFGDPVDG